MSLRQVDKPTVCIARRVIAHVDPFVDIGDHVWVVEEVGALVRNPEQPVLVGHILGAVVQLHRGHCLLEDIVRHEEVRDLTSVNSDAFLANRGSTEDVFLDNNAGFGRLVDRGDSCDGVRIDEREHDRLSGGILINIGSSKC